MKLMQKTPEERYQSAEGIKADLEECLLQFGESGEIDHFPIGRNDAAKTVIISQRLYGRGDETAQLRDLFNKVSLGASETLFISGYSDTGKTALANELHSHITEKKGNFISGKFSPIQKDTPFSAFTEAFGKLCRLILMEQPETLSVYRERLLSALGNNAAVIIDLIPDLELIIGVQPPAPDVGSVDSLNRFVLSFINFIKALCNDDAPLVVFIDDAQWADVSSIRLMQRVFFEAELTHLLFIVSYRSNEVSSSHPLMELKNGLQKKNMHISELKLENLSLSDVADLFADSLNVFPYEVEELAALVYKKTAGNAFFTHQFIKRLASDKLIVYDKQDQTWVWDIKEIEKQDFTDNVADMMSQKIRKLPGDAVLALNSAVCVGSAFSLEMLSTISAASPADMLARLYPSMLEGLIVPLGDEYKYEDSQQRAVFRFLHDRVQQAAYQLVDEDERKMKHHKIARRLLERNDDGNASIVLDIADHFKLCLDLIKTKEEKAAAAGVFLKAGLKAKKSAAYNAAHAFFATGITLLSADSFVNEYPLAFRLYREASETSFLSGKYKDMEKYLSRVLPETQTLGDMAACRIIEIQSLIARNRRKDAVKAALDVLEQLDVSFPEDPGPADIGSALGEMNALIKDADIDLFSDLPVMVDEIKILALRIMAASTSAAFVVSPMLMILLILKQVELSIQYGNLPESAYSYAFYGVVLCGVTGQIEAGYRFGLLGSKLADRQGAQGIRTKTEHVFNDLVRPWKEPLRASIRPLSENFHSGKELGDLEFAAYSAHIYTCYYLYAGNGLASAEDELRNYSNAMKQLGQNAPYSWNLILWQTAVNLLGKNSNPVNIDGSVYDQSSWLSQHIDVNDKMALCYYHLNSAILHFLFYKYSEALYHSDEFKKHMDGATGKYTVALHFFYDSLIRLALYDGLPEEKKREAEAVIVENQQKMKSWALYCPENFNNKYYLVEAERLRIAGSMDALTLYEKAVSESKENRFLPEEALSYELGGKLFIQREMKLLAKTYLHKAFLLYEKWGAKSKCEDMLKRYSDYISRNRSPFDSSTLKTGRNFDHLSIIKASQALSEEIEYDQLLAKLISIAVENAGAEKGVLILTYEGVPTIEAVHTVDPPATVTMQSIPLEESAEVPQPFILSVLNSKNILILDNPQNEIMYETLVYIKDRKPKSLLCMPIIYKGELRGAVYLENCKLAGVFSETRTDVLKILLSQAAISMENAGLFEKVKSERNYSQQLIENSPGLICGITADGITSFINPIIEEKTGYNRSEIVGQNWWKLFYPKEEYKQVEELFDDFFRGEVCNYEMRLTCKDGSKRIIEWNSYTQRNTDNKVKEIIGFGNDITERKLAEDQIRKDLKEREILLRELYHRTKNNMQVIISLLKLRMSSLNNAELSEIFSDITNKIISMSLVHQMLYQSRNLSEINLADYVKELSRMLISSGTSYEKTIAFEHDFEDVMVNIDIAVPLGMVTAELITNTLKHAFNEQFADKQSKITSVIRERDGDIQFEFADNVIGLPKGKDLKAGCTMGVETIFSIVEHQLKGNIHYDGSKGLHWNIVVKKNLYAERLNPYNNSYL